MVWLFRPPNTDSGNLCPIFQPPKGVETSVFYWRLFLLQHFSFNSYFKATDIKTIVFVVSFWVPILKEKPKIRRCRKHITFKNTPLPWFLVFHIVSTQKLSEEKAAKSSKPENLHLQQLAACSYLLVCSFRTRKKKIQQTKNITLFPYTSTIVL